MENQYIAFYGSLMRGFDAQQLLKVDSMLEYEEEGYITGTLYDLGNYPGLKLEGNHSVRCELYKVLDVEVIRTLDYYEHFLPSNFTASLYVRKLIDWQGWKNKIWIYEYNRPIQSEQIVEGGDWLTYKLH